MEIWQNEKLDHLSTWPQGVDNTISKIILGPIVQPQHPQCGNDGWSWPHQDPPSLLPKNAVINCFGLLGCPSFSLLLRPRPCAFLPIQWRLLTVVYCAKKRVNQKHCKNCRHYWKMYYLNINIVTIALLLSKFARHLCQTSSSLQGHVVN